MKVFVAHFYVDFSVDLTAVGATLEAAQHAVEQEVKKYMDADPITWEQDGDRMIGSFGPDNDAFYMIEEVEVVTEEC